MDTLKQILIGFSASAIFIGALTQLFPSGNINKSVKYAVSLLFLCICVTLFTTAQKVKTRVNVGQVQQVDLSVTDAANIQAEYLCGVLLKENGIEYKKLDVTTNIGEDKGIYINSITVYTDCEKNKVIEILEKTVESKRVTVVYE